MQRSTHRSKATRLKAFFSRTFHLDHPAVLDTPQLPLSSGTRSPVEIHGHDLKIASDPVSKTHGSSEPLLMQTSGLNMATLNNGTSGSSPSSLPSPESQSPPLDLGVHNPSSFPHVVNLSRGIDTAVLITETHNPPSLSPTEPHNNPVTGASLFSGARDFVVNNPQITVQQPQGDSITVAQGMKTLSECVIKGAAYDSSLRDPPPQCHPGTRVQLREKIIAWFRDSKREEALLWLKGPAGVGKSAVIQTVAESLAESNSIGATLFFSRLNGRNDPQRVFVTIAFQLATQIPDYQTYITQQIARDPSLLEKGMRDQFRIFIAEPFGNKGIGRGESSRAVLLDGLDECEGVDEQCKIVQLISEFVLRFPDAPFVWAIASRPEPHITGTFNDGAVASSCWSEYMPVDSTQACRDVEHFLDASFKTMRKPFPHLPSDWPSESQFLKLTRGALGLFAFARTAVRFMEDPDHADPVSRLNLILSIIDHLDITVIDDHPFALLDALYTQILRSIPPSVWPNTKRILGLVICTQSGGTEDGLSYPLDYSNRTLVKVSIILGLELSVMYGSLHKLHSVLDIPDSERAPSSGVTFFHASFGDYLTDRTRSKDFYIDRGESVDDVTRCLFQLYLDKPWNTNWKRYASRLSTVAGPFFYKTLRKDAEDSLRYVLTGEFQSRRGRGPFKSQQDRLEWVDALSRIDHVDVSNLGFFTDRTIPFLFEMWNEFRVELESSGLIRKIRFQDIQVDHLDSISSTLKARWISSSSQKIIYDLKHQIRQPSYPETPVIICGSLPENKIAFFKAFYKPFHTGEDGYFCFPYPF